MVLLCFALQQVGVHCNQSAIIDVNTSVVCPVHNVNSHPYRVRLDDLQVAINEAADTRAHGARIRIPDLTDHRLAQALDIPRTNKHGEPFAVSFEVGDGTDCTDITKTADNGAVTLTAPILGRVLDVRGGAVIERGVTLQGSGAQLLGDGGVVQVNPGGWLTLGGHLTNGHALDGGTVAAIDAHITLVPGASITAGVAMDEGGGLYLQGSTLETLSGGEGTVDISGHTAGSRGAGVYIEGGTLVGKRWTLTENQVLSADGKGGGLYAGAESTVTLTNSWIHNNTAQEGGAGIYVTGQAASVELNLDPETCDTITLDAGDVCSEVQGNVGSGIVVSEEATAEVYSTWVDANGGPGLVVDSTSEVTVCGSLFTSNASGGMVVQGTANVSETTFDLDMSGHAADYQGANGTFSHNVVYESVLGTPSGCDNLIEDPHDLTPIAPCANVAAHATESELQNGVPGHIHALDVAIAPATPPVCSTWGLDVLGESRQLLTDTLPGAYEN